MAQLRRQTIGTPARAPGAPSLGRRKRDTIRNAPTLSNGARRCRAKFLRHFPNGFQDETYLDWERDYKWNAHLRWKSHFGEERFRGLLKSGDHASIAADAVAIEARTNLLFSFEKMALVMPSSRPPARGPSRAASMTYCMVQAKLVNASRLGVGCLQGCRGARPASSPGPSPPCLDFLPNRKSISS